MEIKPRELPFEIKDVDPEVTKERLKYFRGNSTGFVQVGPKGYFLPATYRDEALRIYSMPLTPADIFVVTFPRSGTTWVQELVWLLDNDLNYHTADKVALSERYTFLEYSTYFHPELRNRLHKKNIGDPEKLQLLNQVMESGPKKLSAISAGSARYVKTHLPLSLLPPTLLSTARVVYVARDPRDVAVSYFHHNTVMQTQGYQGDFKNFWNLFMKNMHNGTPYFEHVKEAWNQRRHPNMLFLFYEQLSEDLPAVVRRVSDFLGKKYTEEQILRLCEHLHIDQFKNNKSVNLNDLKNLGILSEPTFVREGKVGGWRSYFDEDMMAQAERWMTDNLTNTDLRFSNAAPTTATRV